MTRKSCLMARCVGEARRQRERGGGGDGAEEGRRTGVGKGSQLAEDKKGLGGGGLTRTLGERQMQCGGVAHSS